MLSEHNILTKTGAGLRQEIFSQSIFADHRQAFLSNSNLHSVFSLKICQKMLETVAAFIRWISQSISSHMCFNCGSRREVFQGTKLKSDKPVAFVQKNNLCIIQDIFMGSVTADEP